VCFAVQPDHADGGFAFAPQEFPPELGGDI